MKQWLANILWDAMLLFCGRVHDWVFDPKRAARVRMKHRQRWWAYEQRARQTESVRDDMRARAWAIQFEFKTPPDEAIARGDLGKGSAAGQPYRMH